MQRPGFLPELLDSMTRGCPLSTTSCHCADHAALAEGYLSRQRSAIAVLRKGRILSADVDIGFLPLRDDSLSSQLRSKVSHTTDEIIVVGSGRSTVGDVVSKATAEFVHYVRGSCSAAIDGKRRAQIGRGAVIVSVNNTVTIRVIVMGAKREQKGGIASAILDRETLGGRLR